MSATVRDITVGCEEDFATIVSGGDQYSPPRVFLKVVEERRSLSVNVAVPDFLAAVASELNVRIVPADAIVIERGELPPTGLTSDGSEVFSGSGGPGTRWMRVDAGADAAMQAALAYLAIHKYLAAHPPIDGAQVAALAGLMRQAISGGAKWLDANAIARRLVEAGVRAPEATS